MEEQHFHAQYAVIPAEILYDKELTMADKILYGVISNLCNLKGYCWATNSYLGEVLGQKKDTISKSISRLKNNGYIMDFFTTVNGRRERHLKTYTSFKIPGWDKNPTPVVDKSDTPGTNVPEHLYENKTKVKQEKTGEQTEINVWPTFEDFYNSGLPKADEDRARGYWKKLKQSDKEEIMIYLEDYLESNDKKFLRGTATFLNQKTWKNELINRKAAQAIAGATSQTAAGHSLSGTVERLSSYTD